MITTIRRLTVTALLSWTGASGIACSDHNTAGPDEVQTEFLVSNSLAIPANVSASNIRASISVTDEPAAYVSLPLETFSGGTAVDIENVTRGGSPYRVSLIHGGFDPVPTSANAGDELRLTVVGGIGPVARTVKVPPRRPPIIVRTDPGKGRVDIALNISVTVVFSEPVDPRTVRLGNVYLLKGVTPVPGSVALGENLWTVQFTPDKPLDAQTEYELVVTNGIRDFDGDALGTGYNATFVTGTVLNSPCPGYADPQFCPPFPTGGSGEISGTVLERTASGVKPLGNATVYAWVQLGFPNGGYSRGGTRAAADGSFTITLLPAATIMLVASIDGYDQPCAAVVNFDGTRATQNVEVVSKANPLLAAATKPPVITGLVYETTPSGRKPVPGATIYIDEFDDLLSATSTTDEEGRYAVCNIPNFYNGVTVYAGKIDYQWSWQFTQLKDLNQVDIELKH